MNWLFIFIAAIAAALPVLFIKRYVSDKQQYWLVFSLLSYIILIYAYINIFNNKDIIISYSLVKIVYCLLQNST